MTQQPSTDHQPTRLLPLTLTTHNTAQSSIEYTLLNACLLNEWLKFGTSLGPLPHLAGDLVCGTDFLYLSQVMRFPLSAFV